MITNFPFDFSSNSAHRYTQHLGFLRRPSYRLKEARMAIFPVGLMITKHRHYYCYAPKQGQLFFKKKIEKIMAKNGDSLLAYCIEKYQMVNGIKIADNTDGAERAGRTDIYIPLYALRSSLHMDQSHPQQ